ncbi:hypothetical protein HK22_02015 [Gluconobacter sp. DsW_056]|uniref:hypothetical protein n=1 Tax=Gluconobacter sp. DsW_056 TaxID=1511209 RepID=UPI000A386C59|nr:hypothetical protein [Gluconobacter sp. DsW_056]OUI81657.1 hypothetical protein HK22_02015 [Gluconobacter sp. DsW_056]
MSYIITNLVDGSLFFGVDDTSLERHSCIHDKLGTDIRTYGIENFDYQLLGEPMALIEMKHLFQGGAFGDVSNYMGWTAKPYFQSVTAMRSGNKINIHITTAGVEYADLSGTLLSDKVRWFKEYNRASRRGSSTRDFRTMLRDSASEEIALVVNGRWHKKAIDLPDNVGAAVNGDDLTFHYGDEVFYLNRTDDGLWV